MKLIFWKQKKPVRHIHPLVVVALLMALGSVGGIGWMVSHADADAGWCCPQLGSPCNHVGNAVKCASASGVLFDKDEQRCQQLCMP